MSNARKRGKLVLQLLNELRDKKRVRLLSVEEFDAKSDAILAREIKNGLKSCSLSCEEGKKNLHDCAICSEIYKQFP